jgi:hypothetical protein
MARKCAGSVWEGWGRKMIEEREAKIVYFSCVGVLTLTHFLSPFLPRLRRRQGLGCVSHVRVRVMV